jgi:hypothetical protein
MKFSQAVLIFFLGACCIPTRIVNASIDENSKADIPTTSQIHRSLQKKKSNSNPKKGNNGKGGKKGGNKDCNEGVAPLVTTACPIIINSPGRYVLPDDVQCAADEDGIVINANDVHVDCQDHTITGDVVNYSPLGIFVQEGSSDVTVTNCHATKFEGGIFVDGATGNIFITDSSFNGNRGIGGLFSSRLGSTLTILSSHFDQNGVNSDEIFGRGLDIQGDVGTASIISSSANGNFENGLGVFFNNKVSIWDSEFSNNAIFGVIAGDIPGFPEPVVSLVKSVVCNNNAVDGPFFFDIFNPSIAQAVTCDTSDPEEIGDNPVCQCSCPRKYSGGSSAGGIEVSIESFNNSTLPPFQPYPRL